MVSTYYFVVFFFVYEPVPPEIYTLSLHDALPIFALLDAVQRQVCGFLAAQSAAEQYRQQHLITLAFERDQVLLAILLDRKSTRLNSSHVKISYAVFCLKKKKKYRGLE